MDKEHPVESIDDNYWSQYIEFKEKQLPELKDWEVGKEYTLEIVVKQKSLIEGKKGFRSEFEIVGVKALNGKLNKDQKKIMDFMSDGNESDKNY